MKLIRYADSQGAVHYAGSRGSADYRTVEGDVFGTFRLGDTPAEVAKLLAPVAPPLVLCVGANYLKHIQESNAKVPDYPIVFIKPPTAVQNPLDPILLPRHLRSDQVDYECELAVVIGKTCKNVPAEQALDVVLGYTCANDVSARDWQVGRGGGQWCKAKSFDTFCPLGPCLVTADELPKPNALGIRTILNGETVQESNTADMLFNVPTLIEFLSGSMTLLRGTVVLTGTPSGVGMAATPPRWLAPGDQVSVEIDGIGTLTNPVAEE